MMHLHVDCFSGISGDMFLGALVDIGLPLADLKRGLKKMEAGGYVLKEKKVTRGTIQATKVDVLIRDGFSKPLGFKTIRRVLSTSRLSSQVKAGSLDVFQRLAQAEGTVHGVPPAKVHFHEVGVVDSLVDVVGAFLGCEYLNIKTVSASPINLGSGRIDSAHGSLPVPAPAVAYLVKGVPIFSAGPATELATPTGVAILTKLARDFGPLPPMAPINVGYGAGTSNPPDWPNVLRVFLSESTPGKSNCHEKIVQIQTNVDDLNPQAYEMVMERLFAAGAVDVTLTPVIMKRGRPGIILSVLASPVQLEPVVQTLFQETTTLGVRYQEMNRRVLARRIQRVQLSEGTVRMKVADVGKSLTKMMPEYVDCKKIAKKTGRPVGIVMQQALEAFRKQT